VLLKHGASCDLNTFAPLDRCSNFLFPIGKCKGSTSTTDTSKEAVKKAVEAACNSANYTQEDDCSGLASPEKMATNLPNLDLYHAWGVDTDKAIELATLCEQSGLDYDDRLINSDGATISSHLGCSVYGNSHGFIGEKHASRHSASCVLIAQKGDEMQKDYWYSVARDPNELETMQSIGKKAGKHTVERLGARKVQTGNYPVIFKADIASSLIGHFISGISGGNLYRNASFLKDSLDSKIFPDWLRMHENPYMKKGFASGAYDGDGLQTQVKDFVTDGIVRSYVLDVYAGRKLGLESTANADGVRNLFVDSNAGNLTDLLQSMGTGLLVTDFIGSSVNIVTGDYSRGVSGFWVEKGEIAYPVSEVTIAGHLKDMFAGISLIGSDIDKRNSTYMGSVLIEKMMVAGA